MSSPERTRAATVADVADRAGVSPATAARVLGGYGTTSERARTRVREAAAALGYRPNGIARSMVTRQTGTVGLVVADIENPFFAALTRGFGDVVRDHDYDVMVINTDEDPDRERTALGVLLGRRVDGVAVAPASRTETGHLREQVVSGPPLVLVDRAVAGVCADVVGIDNRAAARVAVEHLVAAGHRRIAMLAGAGVGTEDQTPAELLPALLTGVDRIRGYRDALVAAGLPDDDEYLVVTHFRTASARMAVRDLLTRPHPPTAVFCSDALLSLGVLAAARDLSVRVPESLSLVAFDDADWMEVVSPSVTVVDQPAYEIGATAARRLLLRISGGGGRARRFMLPTTLVSRASVAPPAARATRAR